MNVNEILSTLKKVVNKQDKNDSRLLTNSKEIVGAINENKLSLEERNQQEYSIEIDKFGIYNNGTHPVETRNGLNDAIQYAKQQGYTQLYLPPGDYSCEVDSTSITSIDLPSNTHLRLDSRATIKVNPNANKVYALFLIKDRENVSITGGKIIGDKDNHVFSGDEYMSLIHIWGSKDVTIDNTKVLKSPCLGIRVAEINYSDGTYKECKNIRITNNVIDETQQCGIANEGVDGLWILNNTITNCKGLSMEAGIDLEGNLTKNCYIENNTFYGNGKSDIVVYNPTAFPNVKSDNVYIKNNTMTKRLMVNYNNNESFIDISGNNIITDEWSTGSLELQDFECFIWGKNIKFYNNNIVGRVHLYRCINSEFNNNIVKGKTFNIIECENSEFNSNIVRFTEDKFKNCLIRKNNNITINKLNLLQNSRLVYEDNNTNVITNDLLIKDFTATGVELYGIGTSVGNKFIFNNPSFINRVAKSSNLLINVGSSYITATFNNIFVDNIKSEGSSFGVFDNSQLIINGGTLNINKADMGNTASINKKLTINGCNINSNNTTAGFLLAKGGLSLIFTNNILKTDTQLLAVRTTETSENVKSIVANNIFINGTISIKSGDVNTNNIIT